MSEPPAPDSAPAAETPLRWRLRPGIAIDPLARSGRYQARDAGSGERFELGAEEVFLCQALAGSGSVETIRQTFNARFGLTLSIAQLEQFYQDMAALGLLEALPAVSVQPPVPDPSPAGVEIDDDDRPGDAYRWVLADPQRAFSRWARRLAWLRHGIWLLGAGVPLALLVLLYNQPAYQYALQRLADPGWHLLFKFLFGLLIINLSSKLLQGITCAGCGGRVDQFGLRLAYGIMPRFFVAKRLRALPRPGQLWVTAAALLTKLALFAGGILLWRLTLEGGATLGSYAFVLGHMALGAFLFTANPLWRADGYTWLAIALGMPRLRERAFQVLGLYLRGRRPPARLAEVERYALLGYAVASVIFVLLLAGLVLFALAVYLEARFQGVGVLLFLLLLALVARWLLYRLVQRSPEQTMPAASASGTSRATPAAALEKAPAAAGPEPVRRSWRRWLLLALLLGVAWLPYPYEVTGEVTLFPRARAEVHALLPGVVERVLAGENQIVTSGQVIAELGTWQQDHDIAATTAALERQQAELALLQHGAKAEAINAAREQRDMAQVRAGHSRKLQELLAPVHKTGVVKDLEYQEAVKTADVDQAAVAVAAANLDLIKSPPLPMEVAVQQAALKQLREQLAYLHDQRERTRLRTPIAGTVATPRLEFKTGTFLKEGDLLAVVEDSSVMQAEILAPESDIGTVRVGAPVRLRVWAWPLREFEGQVVAIAPVVELSPSNPFMRVVRVGFDIPNPDGTLKSAMSGFAKISAGEQPLIVAFSRALVRFVRLEAWSWLP
jgi:multidrug efflux pump subunit AcrA (membrane-fusion protein)